MGTERRVGYDMGDVMSLDLPKRRQGGGSYSMPPPFEWCIEGLTELATILQPQNQAVVSRAFDPVSTKANWDLLRSWNFFEHTRMPEVNVRIYEDLPGDPSIKGRIAEELELSDFVDDKRKVLDAMPASVVRRYLYVGPRVTEDDITRPLAHPGAQLIVVRNWRELVQRIKNPS